jgi:hypothetical protein
MSDGFWVLVFIRDFRMEIPYEGYRMQDAGFFNCMWMNFARKIR